MANDIDELEAAASRSLGGGVVLTKSAVLALCAEVRALRYAFDDVACIAIDWASPASKVRERVAELRARIADLR